MLYIYIYVYTYSFVYADAPVRAACLHRRPPHRVELGKGQMGSALMGALQTSCFDRGTFWVLPLTHFCLPNSARAYLLPQSVKIRYTFAAAPLVLTPFVRNQANKVLALVLVLLLPLSVTMITNCY